MDEILYCCSFTDGSENGETVPELLSAMEFDFSSWRDAETGKRTHTLYFSSAGEAAEAKARIESLRNLWRDLEVEIGDPVLAELKKEDWAESWKIHFKPIEISPRLAITPSWISYPAAPGQQIIVDTGHLAAMSASCQLEIRTVPGVKNMLFGGEGVFNTVITGPGHVWLQTMPISNVADVLRPFFPASTN